MKLKLLFFTSFLMSFLFVNGQERTSKLIYNQVSVHQFFGGKWVETDNIESTKVYYWDNEERKLMTEEGYVFELIFEKTDKNAQHYFTKDGHKFVFRLKREGKYVYPYVLEFYKEKKENQYTKCFKYKNTLL